MDKQLELAKSWFVLAQMTIILAGFLFTLSGLAFSNALETMNWGIEQVDEFQKIGNNSVTNISSYQNFANESIQYIRETVVANLVLRDKSFDLAKVLVVVSFFLWMIGRDNIENKGEIKLKKKQSY